MFPTEKQLKDHIIDNIIPDLMRIYATKKFKYFKKEFDKVFKPLLQDSLNIPKDFNEWLFLFINLSGVGVLISQRS